MCENGHEGQCGLDAAKLTLRLRSLECQVFRLIDVHEQCVVERPWRSRYLALSYVWGNIDQLLLQRHSFVALTAPGSLLGYQDQIPKAIRDAIKLVDLIGERYLWVDSLCLVQDDSQSMIDGIRSMNFIYKNALATIVAAEGADASVGLRRLHSRSPSNTQHVQTIKQGIQVTAVGALDVHVRKAKWSTRAWTFQEQLLSRRMIVFVNQQVYFRCRKRIWSEDTFADRFPEKQIGDEWLVDLMSYFASEGPGGGDIEDDPDPLPRLTNTLEYYSMHELTHASDAINAISSVLGIISTSMNSELLQGLPIVALDYMLIFPVFVSRKMQSSRNTKQLTRRRDFPSWSWAGWQASISWNSNPDVSPVFPESFNHWLDHGTWIVWFKSVGFDAPVAVLEGKNVQANSGNKEHISYSRTYQPELLDRFRMLDTSRTVPVALSSINPAYLKQYLLRFYTVSLTLMVSSRIPPWIPWPTMDDRDERRLYMSNVAPSAALYDLDGSFSGLLLLDILRLLEEDSTYGLIILSDSQNSLFERMDLPDMDLSNSFVTHQHAEQDWKLYWVMLIIWNDGVAERRGLGQILRSAVNKSFPPGPQWKEIVLR